MIFPNIAEYEDGDSELAKYTISVLHNRIDKAIEYIKEKYEMTLKDSIEDFLDHDERIEKKRIQKILKILKGEDNE